MHGTVEPTERQIQEAEAVPHAKADSKTALETMRP